MKKQFLLITFFISFILNCFPQAKKPILMVVPSDNWCFKNGYIMEFDEQGTIRKLPDYTRAFQENTEIKLVISKINNLMAERGFECKVLEQEMKNIANQSAERDLFTTKSGATLAESPIDVLKRTAKADIIIELTWQVNQTGPKKSITFILQGIDSYTSKQIAGAEGTGEPSFSAEVPVLLEEAVLSYLDDFNSRLQTHFNNLFEMGREIKVQVQLADDAPIDLEEEFEYNGEELEFGEFIEDWMANHAVKGRFSTADYTENQIIFDQVRIPLYDDRQRALDARRWARDLRKFMRDEPFNQKIKLYTRGLGEVWLIITAAD